MATQNSIGSQILDVLDNLLKFGNNTITGLRTLRLVNSAGFIDIAGTPTNPDGNVITVRPITDTMSVLGDFASPPSIGSTLANTGRFSSVVVAGTNMQYTLSPSGGYLAQELVNTSGGIYRDMSMDGNDYNFREIQVSTTELQFNGSANAHHQYNLPLYFNSPVYSTTPNAFILQNSSVSGQLIKWRTSADVDRWAFGKTGEDRENLGCYAFNDAGALSFTAFTINRDTGIFQPYRFALAYGGYSMELQFTSGTANRTAIFPDKTGTVAFTSDISSNAPSEITSSNVFDDYLRVYSSSNTADRKILGRNLAPFNPATLYWAYDDFVGGNTFITGFGYYPVGSGSGVTSVNNGYSDAFGIASITAGNTSSSLCHMYITNQNIVVGGGGRFYIKSRVRIPVLSDGTNRFICFSGLRDNWDTDGTDGIFFKYSDTLNSGAWQCVTRSNSVATTVNTNVTIVAGTWYNLEILTDAAFTFVWFYINGTQVATSNSNVLTGSSRNTSISPASIMKTLGTVARSMDIDYFVVLKEFSTPR
jgi:hypothetical protein